MSEFPREGRYAAMQYRRCGTSGLRLPVLSLGLWHNFGSVDDYATARAMAVRAFDLGITHFDLANNYGPVPGSAEETMRRILADELGAHRDELIVSTKAGYDMWPGPYGTGGSRKYLLASLDQSLARLGLDYVDVFYHHRPDPDTPLEESMLALATAVQQGKALYVGLSNYRTAEFRAAAALLREWKVPLVLHQPKYSMLVRWVEEEKLLDALRDTGVGCIAFSPLAQGLLTDRYRTTIPADSRAAKPTGFLKAEAITPELRARLERLAKIAEARGQSLAQLALAWVLRDDAVTSVLIGASRVSQIEENVRTLERLAFTPDELREIDSILAGG